MQQTWKGYYWPLLKLGGRMVWSIATGKWDEFDVVCEEVERIHKIHGH